jgi:hypothetical protein
MKATPILIFSALAGSGFMAKELALHTETPVVPVGLDAHETNAGASVLGQFRTSTTGWLWLRTDLYLHNGVEMRPLSQEEVRAGRKGVGSSDAELGAILGDDKIVTVIPSKERDFRGVFGDIERATSTYAPMEMHGHNSPADALPLFRLMTWIDPQFIPGWVTGATIVAGEKSDAAFEKSVALLHEGLAANPKSIVILNELGRFYAGKKKDFPKAISFLVQAVALPFDPQTVSEDEAEAYLNAFRWLALCYRETGKPEEQRVVAAKGLEIFTEDNVLRRLMGEPPFFLSPEGQTQWLENEIAIHTDEKGHEGHDHHDHDHDH